MYSRTSSRLTERSRFSGLPELDSARERRPRYAFREGQGRSRNKRLRFETARRARFGIGSNRLDVDYYDLVVKPKIRGRRMSILLGCESGSPQSYGWPLFPYKRAATVPGLPYLERSICLDSGYQRGALEASPRFHRGDPVGDRVPRTPSVVAKG